MAPARLVKTKVVCIAAGSLLLNVLLISWLCVYRPFQSLVPFQFLVDDVWAAQLFKKSELQHRAIPRQLEETVQQMWNLPYQDLVQYISSSRHIGCGFLEGEIALGILASRDDLEIERFVVGQTLVSYTFAQHSLHIPCSTPAEQLQELQRQIAEEKAPFRLSGLLSRLKRDPQNQALLDAFKRQDAWRGIKKGFFVAPEEEGQFLNTILNMPYGQLEPYLTGVKRVDRRADLKNMALSGNKEAASFLATFEKEYVAQEWSDGEIITLFSLLATEEPSTSRLAVTLLRLPRKPAIWCLCQKVLAKSMNEERLLSVSRQEALQMLSGQSLHHTILDRTALDHTISSKSQLGSHSEKRSRQTTKITAKQSALKQEATKTTLNKQVAVTKSVPTKTIPQSPYRVYVVRNGDTLHSIAKLFSVPLKELEKANSTLVGQILGAGTLVTVPAAKSSARNTTVVRPHSSRCTPHAAQARAAKEKIACEAISRRKGGSAKVNSEQKRVGSEQSTSKKRAQ